MRVRDQRGRVEVEGAMSVYANELQTALQDAMYVPARAIEGYEPPKECYHIVEEMLNGVSGEHDLARAISVTIDTYRSIIRNPMNMSWIARALRDQVEHLIGLADVAIWRKACGGDVGAYKAIVARYGLNGVTKSMHVRVEADAEGIDLKNLSDEHLERIIIEKQRRLGVGEERKRDPDPIARDT